MHVFEEAFVPRSVKGRGYPSERMRDCKIRFAAITCCIFGTKDYISILLKRLGEHFWNNGGLFLRLRTRLLRHQIDKWISFRNKRNGCLNGEKREKPLSLYLATVNQHETHETRTLPPQLSVNLVMTTSIYPTQAQCCFTYTPVLSVRFILFDLSP